MGQKTNPIGLRIAVNHDWRSKWYSGKKEFGKLLTEDYQIRSILKRKLESASVPKILIERAANRCRNTIFTARPGVVIGRRVKAGLSLVGLLQLSPPRVMNTSSESAESFGSFRSASTTRRAATVSGHRGHRRATPVFIRW